MLRNTFRNGNSFQPMRGSCMHLIDSILFSSRREGGRGREGEMRNFLFVCFWERGTNEFVGT